MANQGIRRRMDLTGSVFENPSRSNDTIADLEIHPASSVLQEKHPKRPSTAPIEALDTQQVSPVLREKHPKRPLAAPTEHTHPVSPVSREEQPKPPSTGVIKHNPRIKRCLVCYKAFNDVDFPAAAPTAECTHSVQTCKECLQKWVEAQLGVKGRTYVRCPDCMFVLSKLECLDAAPPQRDESPTSSERMQTKSVTPTTAGPQDRQDSPPLTGVEIGSQESGEVERERTAAAFDPANVLIFDLRYGGHDWATIARILNGRGDIRHIDLRFSKLFDEVIGRFKLTATAIAAERSLVGFKIRDYIDPPTGFSG